MLKREIKYTDFDGEEMTDTVYFNLSKSEIIEWEASVDGGLHRFVQKIVETKNNKQIIDLCRDFILKAYGVREGTRFVKNDKLREEFTQTAAYDALFMEIATNEKTLSDFIIGVVPAEFRAQVNSDKPILPPPSAPPPKAA